MPSRIPVRISEREFPSLNQARLHYVGILRKYQPGQAVSQDDGRQVSELLPNSANAHSLEGVHEFRVVHGNYGRTCFANVDTEKHTRLISIMRSVKSFVDPVVLLAQAEPQISATAEKSEVGVQETPAKELKEEVVLPGQEVQIDGQNSSGHKVPEDGAQPAVVASLAQNRKSSKAPVASKLQDSLAGAAPCATDHVQSKPSSPRS